MADLDASELQAPIVGHVGDGNFHLVLLIDPENASEVAAAHTFSNRLVERAISMEGTCTGEHGIGFGKKRYMALEHGDAALKVMRAVKQALDPLNLMNPGKVLPDA